MATKIEKKDSENQNNAVDEYIYGGKIESARGFKKDSNKDKDKVRIKKKQITFYIHKITYEIIKGLAKDRGYGITHFLMECCFGRIKIKKNPKKDWIESKKKENDFIGVCVYLNESQYQEIQNTAHYESLPIKVVFLNRIKKVLFK